MWAMMPAARGFQHVTFDLPIAALAYALTASAAPEDMVHLHHTTNIITRSSALRSPFGLLVQAVRRLVRRGCLDLGLVSPLRPCVRPSACFVGGETQERDRQGFGRVRRVVRHKVHPLAAHTSPQERGMATAASATYERHGQGPMQD